MTNEEAIKVLLDEWKCIDRNDGINCDRKCESCDLVMDSFVLKDAYNMAIKALEQQPMPTMVYPQVEGITPVVVEPIPKLPPVNQQEPSGDLISRQDAIKAINEKAKRIKSEDTLNGLAGAVGILFDLPPVKSQEKTGHWIQENSVLRCSICDVGVARYDKYSYCPNCGTKMIEKQKRSNKCKNCKYYRNPDYTRCHKCEAERSE